MNDKERKYETLTVASLGPGNPKYILPAAMQAIEAAEVVACGKRHLESFDASGKEVHIIGTGGEKLSAVMAAVKAVYPYKKTVLVVSGDCGFYSLLRYAGKVIGKAHIKAIPGVSSLTYFYAKLSLPWQDAALISLHGRDQDLVGCVKRHSSVGVLTDGVHNAAYIAKQLKENGLTDKVLYVGEDLSYPEERISRLSVEEGLAFQEKGMSVVIVADE
ncbi:precorrin-6y C5,15-methyltransferase (decarboxylating) subunit CbiE [Pseudoramibacter sp.]|jgi:cobalt-precorrin-7 (C5)-methyltransferase|uniref:precorrin-6y C5,15-methyltransferase (decarboxylating) subunit CbiE n=1 Tax=Pseudoramibacter sp. TaxID=2034862 RepID=UPI0026009D7F|nr:precorrin-6y C5,15-methyltransferase (decarboxylating) subunit CbiE [Pseudoramibacter sp.]MCH4072203.1 precorrin-6y C5,15-methyltransferase (decarboxylating) subunit CbiE [Pseudoramibacter sp.]MCH4105973.1 precorrin-6y C5,15-methyltransferase (decarboxylating) subunit CbiE [Pseudoramibacter sp.]